MLHKKSLKGYLLLHFRLMAQSTPSQTAPSQHSVCFVSLQVVRHLPTFHPWGISCVNYVEYICISLLKISLFILLHHPTISSSKSVSLPSSWEKKDFHGLTLP